MILSDETYKVILRKIKKCYKENYNVILFDLTKDQEVKKIFEDEYLFAELIARLSKDGFDCEKITGYYFLFTQENIISLKILNRIISNRKK